VVHKPQVVRCLTGCLSKSSLSAYSTYRIEYVSCFTSYACDDCALRIRFLDDGDRLHGSNLLYIILIVDVLLLFD
jgi:hypothetical protein